MPPLETSDLYQLAVVWMATGQYDSYGEPLTADPVEISVRWITKRREALDAKKNTIALDATAITNQLVPVGSKIWLGSIDDWDAVGTAYPPDNETMQVKTYTQTSDLKNRFVRYELGLMRQTQTGNP